MKKVLIISLLLLLTASGYAKKNKAPCPVTGIWKYSNSSANNDFQQISRTIPGYKTTVEYLVFKTNNEFSHNFLNEKGQVVKTLNGKWKIQDKRIKISYADIDFELLLNYFFLDKDLVLGQNFNHIIFSKDNLNEINLASK